MTPGAPNAASGVAAAWSELQCLAAGRAAPKEFWRRFTAAALTAAECSVLAVVISRAQESPRVIASASLPRAAAKDQAKNFLHDAPQFLTAPAEDLPNGVIRATISTRRQDEKCAVVALENSPLASMLLLAVAMVPSAYESTHALTKSEGDAARLAQVFDAVLVTNAEERFSAAAMALCNALATHYRCERASLSWLVNGCSRLQAVSRLEQFDRKMEAAQKLEAAMDECLDQDAEILWPPPPDSRLVARDHQALAANNPSAHLCSLPLRHEDMLLGVITCERATSAFDESEVEALRLAARSAAPRLAVLRQRDRWWGSRFMAALRQKTSGLLGPKHTLSKLAAILIALALGVLFFWQASYRVEGSFVLRSEAAATLSAPFDGFINEVLVQSGDSVTKDQVLLRLDTAPLLVEQSAALAELERYRTEADKARAARSIAEMQIAEALGQQAQAKLEVIRYRLHQAEVRSPLAGVVVEGDLKERLHAPVKQGDGLFRLAQPGTLYAELKLDERDAHEVTAGAEGEVAFVSQPEHKIPVRLTVLLPAAAEQDGQHYFAGRAAFRDAQLDWWRPGMSGVCKLDAGRRSLFWILTHRTADFLRMKLWW